MSTIPRSAWGNSTRHAPIKDRQATPYELVAAVESALNMAVAWDVCAEAATAKAPRYWTREQNALGFDWALTLRGAGVMPGSLLWMNPPYSAIPQWLARAIRAARAGYCLAVLVPDDRSTAWYRQQVRGVAHTLLVPQRRVNFLHPETGVPIRGNPRPSILPIYGPWGPWSMPRVTTCEQGLLGPDTAWGLFQRADEPSPTATTR